MNVLLDTNIVIDVLARREPFYYNSARILQLCKQGAIRGYICSLSFATIAYVIRKRMSQDEMYSCLNTLTQICNISIVDDGVISNSIKLRRKDFEDSIQYCSAVAESVSCIISRDTSGFSGLDTPVFSPEEFLDKCK